MSGDPAVRYYPDTDTLYVEIRPGPTVCAEDAGEDLVIHYDDQDRPAGYEIEHASRNPGHIAKALTALRTEYWFRKRAAGPDPADLERILAKAGDEPPREGDEPPER